MPHPIDAMVFDLGNVLIEVDFLRCAHRWGELAGVEPAALLGRFRIDRHYERHERGETDHRQYFAVLREQLGIQLSDPLMADGWNAIIGEAFPGVCAALAQACRALPCYVLTNTNRLHESLWESKHSRLLAPVAGVFSSCRLGCRKPEPRIYGEVLARAGLPPERILLLDDGPANIAGAAACGMQTKLVRSAADTLEAIRGALAARRNIPGTA
jgi:HAD superfamily hydrolase (TIGR01509 family)